MGKTLEKASFELKVNRKKNVVFCQLKGEFMADEARDYTERFKKCVDQLQAGFTGIVDLRDYNPCSADVDAIFRKGTEYAAAKGIARTIRIVSDRLESTIGNMQLNRAARELGYVSETVHSLSEAEKLLGLR